MTETISKITLNTGENTKNIYSILRGEDFSFPTKNIDFDISLENNSTMSVHIKTQNIMELKIAFNSLIKAIQVFEITKSVIKNEKRI